MEKKMPREMTGAELKSMLKSSINFKSLGGVKVEGLKLSEEDLAWWRDAKIGMFVHWGLYSILGRGEWARFNEHIPAKEYEALAEEFVPQDFSTDEWAALAKEMGANYMVLVTRHHDGFALWNSPGSYGDFTTAKTGSKRDFVAEFTDSCRKQKLKVGYYYSPMDWRFPGYFDPEGLPENAALMKQQCYEQVEELVSKYGRPDILWYDGGWLAHKGSDTSSAWFWEPGKLNQMVRKHSPKTVINPRSGWEGDFYCDEGSHEIKGSILPVPWEKNMCICSGCSWGYMPEDTVSDLDFLIRMLVDVVCRDGNLLLNIGPDRNGKVSEQIQTRIRELGQWLQQYGESIYKTRGGPIEPKDGVYGTTCQGHMIYVHLMDAGAFRGETLPFAGGKVLKAYFLNSKKSVSFFQDGAGIRLQLPEGETEPVIALVLDGDVEIKKQDEVYFTGGQ